MRGDRKVKRFFDIVFSGTALVVLLPVMLAAGIGIRLSSRGPVIYKARRMGKGMIPFSLYKFRTMGVGADRSGAITAVGDSRVFPFGGFLRKFKIDELPQLANVLAGTMSIVGPRPESVEIVERHYTQWMEETLSVLPGLASPGSIFNYTHGGRFLEGEDTEGAYVERLLPVKLAMDLYYVRNGSLLYDMEIVVRTVLVIIGTMFGKTDFRYPREYEAVKSQMKNWKDGMEGSGKR